MVALKTWFLAAVSVTAATSKAIRRDAASIQSSLETVNSDVVSLGNAVNNYNGGLFGAIPVQSAESQLEDDIDSATNTAQASGPINSADSAAIIGYINDTLEPNIDDTITALINKQGQFQSAGLAGTVSGDLDTLQSKTNDLGDALIAKAADDQKASGRDALAKINADFQRAIAAYN